MATVVRIEAHPKVWPWLHGQVRKCLVLGFPYKLLYTIEPERLHVVAVMHGKTEAGLLGRAAGHVTGTSGGQAPDCAGARTIEPFVFFSRAAGSKTRLSGGWISED